MFKIKAYHVHPVNVVCITLLVTIILMLLVSGKPVTEPTPYEPSVEQFEDSQLEQLRDYQLQITPDGKYIVMYDYNRLVGVLPLDNHCNLTNLVMFDNQ